jgi:hypothetical protein
MAKKFNPSADLLEWIRETILLHMNRNGGKAFWSHLQTDVWRRLHPPAEWIGMTNYAKVKAFNLTLDSLSEKRMIFRTKNYQPYTLLNPLDLIVEALIQDEQSSSKPHEPPASED